MYLNKFILSVLSSILTIHNTSEPKVSLLLLEPEVSSTYPFEPEVQKYGILEPEVLIIRTRT